MVYVNPGCAGCAATLGSAVEPPCGSLEGTVLESHFLHEITEAVGPSRGSFRPPFSHFCIDWKVPRCIGLLATTYTSSEPSYGEFPATQIPKGLLLAPGRGSSVQ